MNRRVTLALAVMGALACDGMASRGPVQQSHSSTIAVSPDATHLFVVHPDADSVTIVNRSSRAIEHDVLLAATPPAADPARDEIAAMTLRSRRQRSRARLPLRRATLYVTGQRSGHVYVDRYGLGRHQGQRRRLLGAHWRRREPRRCSRLRRLFARRRRRRSLGGDPRGVEAEPVPCPRRSLGSLAWAADGQTLYATHLLEQRA